MSRQDNHDIIDVVTLSLQQDDTLSKNKYIIDKDNTNRRTELSYTTIEAKKEINQGIQLLQKRGYFLLTKQDTQSYLKAAQYIEKAIMYDSNYINAYNILTQIYYKLDSNKLALDVLNRLLIVKPNSIEAITTKGFVYERIGLIEKANLHYIKALHLYSNQFDKSKTDYINEAFLYLLLYGEKDGIKEIQKVKNMYPDGNIENYILQFNNFNRGEFIKHALD